jgi:hypothetical protein
VDVVAKSTFDPGTGPVSRGWLYTGLNNFQSDQSDETTNLATLEAGAAPGFEVTFCCVPAGTGQRLGVDRDEDGLFDFDEVRADLGGPNPFDPDVPDASGDNGSTVPDGVPDGLNDFDNDGVVNSLELQLSTSPLTAASAANVPANAPWSLLLTLTILLSGLGFMLHRALRMVRVRA